MHAGCIRVSIQQQGTGRQLAPPPPAIGKKDGTTSPININPAPWQEESEKGSPNPNNGDPVAGWRHGKKMQRAKTSPPPSSSRSIICILLARVVRTTTVLLLQLASYYAYY